MAKPELLAPAGSLESFHAAIEAGADALYLGLQHFNARLRAKNFSMQTLSYLVPYAHKNRVKIYCTLNTLVKQQELPQIINLLYQLEQIGIDAVILQDLGIAEITRKYFPKLALHTSTQMVIHNSPGAHAAAELGFKRIILSRECTLSEIAAIRKATSLQLEVFVHGALCYSISGLCLASSYLGGKSGNRGCCTQVCRRQFATDYARGFYFSPMDLCAIDLLPALRDTGITSLKIEGRMKNADNVFTVVNTYRKAIDTIDEIPEIKKALFYDFGRAKTTAFLTGYKPEKIIDASSPPGAGLFVGHVLAAHRDRITLETDEEVTAGDTIRIHDSAANKGFTVKVTAVERQKKELSLFVTEAASIPAGSEVYIISRHLPTRKKWSKIQINGKPVRYRQQCHFSQRILKTYSRVQKTQSHKHKTAQLYLRFDSMEWLYHLKSIPCDGIILNGGKSLITTLKTHEKVLRSQAQKLTIALPPFIPQHDIPLWEKTIRTFQNMGISRWMCSNIGQKYLVSGHGTCITDTTIWCTNRATQHCLKKNGFSRFTYSLEDDILNCKATGNTDGLMVLFGYIPLFISRIKPHLAPGAFLTESDQTGFFLRNRDGLYYLIGAKPLCLTHRRDKLHAIGIHTFILDFSFCPVRKKILTTVLTHYTAQKKLPDSILFNHKRGLK